jgi:hypothetical protein
MALWQCLARANNGGPMIGDLWVVAGPDQLAGLNPAMLSQPSFVARWQQGLYRFWFDFHTSKMLYITHQRS